MIEEQFRTMDDGRTLAPGDLIIRFRFLSIRNVFIAWAVCKTLQRTSEKDLFQACKTARLMEKLSVKELKGGFPLTNEGVSVIPTRANTHANRTKGSLQFYSLEILR